MKNKRIPFIGLIILMLTVFVCCSKKPIPSEIETYADLKKLFADPPSDYRTAPLWDWNDSITKEGIDFQMNEFRKGGLGGVFVHPRPGLLTEYLSGEWFELFDHAVQKGKSLGMKVWIYDENSYPSGFAGGHVPAEMPDAYQHGTGLSMDTVEHLNIPLSDTIAVILKRNGDSFVDVTQQAEQERGKAGPYYIFRKTYPQQSPWYGGFAYVDLIYKGVTEKFIDLTMTKGYERNRADFGKTLPGIFTDEPNLEAAMSRGSVMRWTPDLFDAFQERWGYDLRVNLPLLVEETGDWKKVRHDYYELLLELFVDRWVKPWSKYCDENNLKWTGHYWEHGWPEPTHGLDEAAVYIWHQQPGVDMLGNRLDSAGLGGQFGNDRAVRELRSAANQAGRTRTLSETYGGGGWEMGFEAQKRLVDWQCVMGVNFVNQHLSYYTLKGVRKFDYPPSFSYHEPWWEHYRLMADYIGRISLATSLGQQINETLVLQPNTTAWMYFSRKVKNPAIQVLRDSFKRFVHTLEQMHLEYDLGSENVLKTLGTVEGNSLRVGQRDYKLVVIPAEMENIDQRTYELLKKYLEQGGRILSFVSGIPRVDGEESSKSNDLQKAYPSQWVVAENVREPGVQKLLVRDEFSIRDLTRNGMLYHQRRVLENGQFLFVVNAHPTKKASAEVTMKGKSVTRFDLLTGKAYNYTAEPSDDKVSFQITLDVAGSALFLVTDDDKHEPPYEPESGMETVVEGTHVELKRESDNILVINYLDLKTSKSDKKGIYFMNALIGLFNENGVQMGNPWQHKIQYRKSYLALDSLFREDSGFEASYHFQINQDLDAEAMKRVRAVVERPELWDVSINGNPVKKTEDEFWIDRDLSLYSIGQFLKPGKNTLTLRAPRMHILAEVMPVYIVGDFLIQPAHRGFAISGGDISTTGSWKENGLPFYSGKVSYSRKVTLDKKMGDVSYKVKLGRWNGSIGEVWVNGEKAGLIAWKPYEVEVTPFLRGGDNEIVVKVTGSLKNTFGFFYDKNDNWIFGPHSWNRAPEQIPPASGYFLVDYGLFEPFTVVRVNSPY